MATTLCQPSVALRSRYDDGLGWGFFWFVVGFLSFLGICFFLVYKFWWLPRKAAQSFYQQEEAYSQHDWRPSTLRWSDLNPGTMQSTGIPAGYSLPKNTPIPITRISSNQQAYSSQPPPVVVIPPDMDFTKSPSPLPIVPFSPQGQYNVQQAYNNELAPYPAGDRRPPSYNANSSVDPPNLPYEAVAVRTTTTTRRTAVLSPISHSRVTTIV